MKRSDVIKKTEAKWVVLLAVLIAAILFSVSDGQNKPAVTINDFSGGLNTKTNPFLLKPNELIQAHNWLLDAEYGSLVLRMGDLARTDTLQKEIADPAIWDCGIDTVYIKFGGIHKLVFFTCDSLVPTQDHFWIGQDADSLNRTAGASPPPAWLGKDFTIINSAFGEFLPVSEEGKSGFLFGEVADVELVKGDSLQITMDTAGFRQAIDTGGVTGLYAFYSKPTTKSLLYVIPGFGSQNQWSSLYASRSQRYNPTTFLADYIYKGETPIWETWNGFVYVALPRQRPLVTNGTRTVHLVPRAPGQIEIVPAQPDTPSGAWTIDGAPRYAVFRMTADTSGPDVREAFDQIGYISHSVPVYNEWNLLYAFPRSVADSVLTLTRPPDSVLLLVTRTRGDPQGSPKFIDSFFVIDTIVGLYTLLDTLKLIDSIPNDSLGTTSYPFVGVPAGLIPYDTGYVDSATDILDTTGSADRHFTFSAPGAPTFVKQEFSDTVTDWWPDNGDTVSSNRFHRGWEYGYTKFDTVMPLPLMSDMSPTLIIATGIPRNFFTTGVGADTGNDSTSAITINIPALTAFDTSQARVIWRRQIKLAPNLDSFIVATDTFLIVEGRIISGEEFVNFAIGSQGSYEAGVAAFARGGGLSFRNIIVYPDTIITKSAYFPVGIMLDGADTLFIDSVNWLTWVGGGRTGQSIDIDARFNPIDNRMDIVKGFFAFKDNLFAWTDERLFRSTLDTPVFKPFNDVKFTPGGGDVITQVTRIGPNLLVFFSDGLIELYDPVGTLPQKGSPVSGFGCMAPQSLINYGGTAYFMAKDGIRTISSHQVKSFGVANKIISTKINDLIVDGRSDSLKSTMAAGIGPDGRTIVFCYPSIDTMFIYYPELDAWTTRDGSFFQATNYDTTSIEGLLHSSKMVYARTGDERVFEYEGNNIFRDSGLSFGNVIGTLKLPPIFADHNIWQVTQVGLLRGDSTRTSDLSVTNEAGGGASRGVLGANVHYSIFSMPLNEGSYLSLKYSTNVAAAGSETTIPDTLRRIDIWGVPIAVPITK